MTTLKIGDKAPDFTGVDAHGRMISLKDYIGKELVIYFYPKDNTPGCTAQACNIRDNYEKFLSAGYAVIGISADNEKSHTNFINKYNLPFPLIADTDKKILKTYGVWGPKKFMGRAFDGIHRTTFIISKEGIIGNIIDKVDTKNHTAQIIK